MVPAVPFDRSAFAVHISRPHPIGQTVVWPVFAAPLGHHVQNAIGAEKLFAAAPEGRVGEIDLTCIVLQKYAAAGEVLQSGRPVRCLLEVVERAAGRNLLRRERDVEIVVEVRVVDESQGNVHPMRWRTTSISSIGARATAV